MIKGDMGIVYEPITFRALENGRGVFADLRYVDYMYWMGVLSKVYISTYVDLGIVSLSLHYAKRVPTL